MRHIICLCCIAWLLSNLQVGFAQKPEVIIRIEEDYTNPNPRHYEKSTEWVDRKIENGVYIAQSADKAINAELAFGLKIEQRNCYYNNDVLFKIQKIKGKTADFIGVQIILFELAGPELNRNDYHNEEHNSVRYDFLYNEEGQWKLIKDYKGEIVQSGDISVHANTNDLLIEHTSNKTIFSLNGQSVCELNSKHRARLEWSDIKIIAENQKTVIGLDQAVFNGYYHERNPPVISSDIYNYQKNDFEYIPGLAVKGFNESKYRYMDDYGRLKGNARFDDADWDQNKYSLILVENNELYGYINHEGDWVIQAEYIDAADRECYETNSNCIKGYFKVKKAEDKEFLVNAEGKIVPLVNGKLSEDNVVAKGTEVTARTASQKSREGFTTFTIGKFSFDVYSNWLPHLHANDDNSASTTLDNQTIELFGNGPKSWVNKEKQNIYGGFSITIEDVESNYEKEKDALITYYADARASRWDAQKSNYKIPTKEEINKEKVNIKPFAETVVFKNGSSGKSLFYIAGIPGLGQKMMYIIVVPNAANPKMVRKLIVKIEGETQAHMEATDFKAWNDYFKAVVSTFNTK